MFAVLSIIGIIATLELRSAVVKGRYEFEEDFDGFLSSTIFLGVLITAGFYAFVLCFQDFFVRLLDMDMIYINIMFLDILISPALNILQAKNRILQKYKSFVAVSIGATLGTTFLSVYCVTKFEDRLLGRIAGATIPMIILYLIAFIIMMARGKKLYNKEYWKFSLFYSLPLVPHLLSNNLLNASDKIMIQKMCGPEDNAAYSLAYSCGMIVTVLLISLNQAWEPWLFDKLHNKKYDVVKKLSNLYLVFFVIIVEGLILIAPELMYFMGDKFENAKYVVPPVMLGYGYKFACNFYINVERFEKKNKFISVGTMLAAGINIGLNYIFIPIYGFIAAAYTTLAGFMILTILHYFQMQRLDLSQRYNNKFIFGVLTVMTVAGISIQVLYTTILLRYLMVLLVGGVVFFLAFRLYKKKEVAV